MKTAFRLVLALTRICMHFYVVNCVRTMRNNAIGALLPFTITTYCRGLGRRHGAKARHSVSGVDDVDGAPRGKLPAVAAPHVRALSLSTRRLPGLSVSPVQ